MADIDVKNQILDSLEGSLVVTKVEEDFTDGTAIICKFVRNDKEGLFRFIWAEDESGIDYVRDYYEEDIDYIENEIFEWVDKHFKFSIKASLKYDGKELLK